MLKARKFYHKGSALVRVPEQNEGNAAIPIAVTGVQHEDKCHQGSRQAFCNIVTNVKQAQQDKNTWDV